MIKLQRISQFGLVLVAGVSGQPAFAGDEIERTKERARITATSPNADATAGRVLPQVLVRSDVESSEAKLIFSTASDAAGGLGKSDFSINFTIPFDDDEGRSDFVTETGLPNRLGVGLSFSTNFTPIVDESEEMSAFAADIKIVDAFNLQYRTACQNWTVTELAKLGEAFPVPISDQEELFNKNCDLNIPANVRNKKTMAKILGKSDADVNSIVGDLNKNLKALSQQVANRSIYLLNLNASVGTEKFAFRHPTSFGELVQRRRSSSFGGSFGVMPKLKTPLLLALGGEFKDAYKAPDKQIKCKPTTIGSVIDCTNAVFGPPKKDDDAKIFGLARYIFEKGGFAIEVKGAYDFEDKDWGFEVPVYLVRDSKDKLRGGFRLLYDSDDGKGKEDWQFGIFISQPFDFLKL